MNDLITITAVSDAGAIVVRSGGEPVTMTWGLLHEAQQQIGPTGMVYRWIMIRLCRRETASATIDQIVRQIAREDAAKQYAREKAESEHNARVAAESAQKRDRAERDLVEAERKQLDPSDPWEPIRAAEIPERVRFDVLRQDAGQIVEYSYGDFGASEAGTTSPYKCRNDRSMGSDIGAVRYYRRRKTS